MDTSTVLALVKARLGISTKVRDEYLNAIVKGVLSELDKVNGLTLNADDHHHLMFVVDFAAWRYQNRDVMEGMPRHLQFRLHNLMIAQRGESDGSADATDNV